MKRIKYGLKYENCILTLIILLLHVILMGICFDFYYDLNDDTMMKDIMSGVYTGTPDGHNMQTLYLLGMAISWCYRLCGRLPWYGLFLCFCQFGCFWLLGVRLTGLIDCHRKTVRTGIEENGCTGADRREDPVAAKIGVLLLLALFQWGICLTHMVNAQYTITSALMSATAIFFFVTTPETGDWKQFVIRNIPSVFLIILAFQLRTEMLLLTLPFVALGGMLRWAEEERIFAKENWKKYGSVIGIILAGLLLSWLPDLAAYGSEQWQDFRNFFEARTTVYDFYPEVITQEEYGTDLEQLGVTSVQRELLRNYNFGLDDAIDTPMLEKTAAYATGTVGASRDWGAVFREKSRLYLYRLTHAGDAPYNFIVLWAYAALLVTGAGENFRQTVKAKTGEAKPERSGKDRTRRKGIRNRLEKADHRRRGYLLAGWIVLVTLVRTAIWMFILMRGRDPERITHSLYLVEFVLLTAALVRRQHICPTKKYGTCILRGMTVLLLLVLAGGTVTGIRAVQEDQRLRETVNRDWQEIDAYCRAHGDSFYFEDVYSTVAFSQKMFADVNNTFANYDILGGWMCKSPLYREKLAQYDIDSAGDALLYQDNVYLIVSDGEEADQGFDWIIDFYADRGIAVSVTLCDRINENYGVYTVE